MLSTLTQPISRKNKLFKIGGDSQTRTDTSLNART
jgi:hypothetical protein